ncbi:MAG: hypothetical protein IPP61_05015 [Cytophagaceae bacterium]|nr:hypothetical protein [Cytophagaceae bacterium]MBL0301706.1 hypothetical protein [Cytophagaceae bacterium]MBL0324529.1 hypothetical protein [Cytophagaceae bacterium]
MKIKATNRTAMASLYEVSLVTFNKWLMEIEDLKLDPKKRILSPKQVQIIVENLGDPSGN